MAAFEVFNSRNRFEKELHRAASRGTIGEVNMALCWAVGCNCRYAVARAGTLALRTPTTDITFAGAIAGSGSPASVVVEFADVPPDER